MRDACWRRKRRAAAQRAVNDYDEKCTRKERSFKLQESGKETKIDGGMRTEDRLIVRQLGIGHFKLLRDAKDTYLRTWRMRRPSQEHTPSGGSGIPRDVVRAEDKTFPQTGTASSHLGL